MNKRLIINDCRSNKLVTGAIVGFMSLTAMMLGVSILLFGNLWSSMDRLMEIAKTPDWLQMHGGELEESRLEAWARENPAVEQMQICRFLNLENGSLYIGERSLSDSTQDNGVCVQNQDFDHLVDMEGTVIWPAVGEIYVPVCYRAEYGIQVGDVMQIGTDRLVVAGFLRDSQMNSMMASSKRFLVNQSDYDQLTGKGEEEYLIEFRLKAGSDVNAFSTEYMNASLPGNGPTITGALIRMMNALSDGIMILVILLVAIVVLIISILCIRYLLLTGLEKDRREIGMLKGIGIAMKDIKGIYFTKFLVLSALGAVLGAVGALLVSVPLGRQMRELYGSPESRLGIYLATAVGIVLIEAVILLSVDRTLGQMRRLSAVDAMFGRGRFDGKKNRYMFIGVISACAVALMLVPTNMSHTLSSPDFVTYMGIGDSQIRIDIRQSDDIQEITSRLLDTLESDDRLADYVVMKTGAYRVELGGQQDEEKGSYRLLIENGDHSVHPVSFSQGHAPASAGEIALSRLNAQDLGVQLGDEMTVICIGADGTEIPTVVSVVGIYSDITNGGRTAKICMKEDATPVMWSIIYLNLKDGVQLSDWVAEYKGKTEALGQGIKVTDISGYVNSTYGTTIRNINRASMLASLASALVVGIVTLLFVRLVLWQERMDCSFKKALGFQTREIRQEYLGRTLIYIVVGAVIGIFIGLMPGQILTGQLLGSLGISDFRFVVDPFMSCVVIPMMVILVGLAATGLSLRELRNIRAYECCVGRE